MGLDGHGAVIGHRLIVGRLELRDRGWLAARRLTPSRSHAPVGTNATSDGLATDGRVIPTPERLALTRLVNRGADHRVVMIHSPATRDAAENLARDEGMTEVVDYIPVDPFGDVPSHARLVAEAIRTAARKANVSLASSAASQVVIDVTGGLLTMSLIGGRRAQHLPRTRDDRGLMHPPRWDLYR